MRTWMLAGIMVLGSARHAWPNRAIGWSATATTDKCDIVTSNPVIYSNDA